MANGSEVEGKRRDGIGLGGRREDVTERHGTCINRKVSSRSVLSHQKEYYFILIFLNKYKQKVIELFWLKSRKLLNF